MSSWIYFSVKLLHVLAMAVYIGATVAAPIGMRRAFALGAAHGHDFMVRLQQSGTSGGGLSVVFSDGKTTTQPVPLSAVTSVVINGVGVGKLDRYGAAVLEVIADQR